MNEEFEVKFLNINPSELEQKLLSVGAEKIGDFFYRRSTFDYPDFRLDSNFAWVRVRDEGNRTTMAFKQGIVDTNSTTWHGTNEYEVEVSDFETARKILINIGLIEKFYHENRRTRYIKDGITFDIDTWPMIHPYLEIEGTSWQDVERSAELLGLDIKESVKFSTTQVYEQEGIRDKDYQRITFDEQIKRA